MNVEIKNKANWKKATWCENKGYNKTWKFHFKWKSSNKKEIRSCNDQSLIVKMEKGNYLRIYCSTTTF